MPLYAFYSPTMMSWRQGWSVYTSIGSADSIADKARQGNVVKATTVVLAPTEPGEDLRAFFFQQGLAAVWRPDTIYIGRVWEMVTDHVSAEPPQK